jgi:hypothetical protein
MKEPGDHELVIFKYAYVNSLSAQILLTWILQRLGYGG